MTTALMLVGHGSHITPETAGLVWTHVDALRAMGVADEVTAAFWKEQPSFHTVFNALDADDITVVPLFTADGYFTQTVIPAEMGLTGAITHRSGRTIRYARTLNQHPYLSDVVRRRVEDTAESLNVPPNEIAVALIGHSTRRNPESRKATEAQAAKIREWGVAAEVCAVYLDDSPAISDIYTLTHAPNIIAVPYFLAMGSHTTIDVPTELGLEPGKTCGEINERKVYYTSAVGIDEALRTAILDLAREAGAPLSEARLGSIWDCFPTFGRETFIRYIQQETEANGSVLFGQLVLSPPEVHAQNSTDNPMTVQSPDMLRRIIRENPFRSLPTAVDLPGNWRILIETPGMLHAVVETVYPGAVADWARQRRGIFQPNTFEATISRQTGNFRQLADLKTGFQQTIINSICGNCVRHPTWFTGGISEGVIPCPEPCNHWLSAALEAMK